MSNRTDRITKLTTLINQANMTNQPNKADKLSEKLAKFEDMADHQYDYLMALNTATLADPTVKPQDFYQSYYSQKHD